MNRTVVLRSFHVFNHLAVAIGLFTHWSWIGFAASCFVYSLIGCFGISIGYHRLLSHRSFAPKSWFKNFCLFFGFASTGGSPISWAAAHRVHHLHSDSDQDVHSLKRDGILKVYFHFWHPFVIKRRIVRDLLNDRSLTWIHRHYFKLLSAYVILLYALDLRLGLYAYSLPAVLAFHFYGLINVLGHSRGTRPLDTPDSTYNNWFANLFTFGEGWHQNHHFLPASHRIGFRKFEFDISAWFIEKFPVAKDQVRVLKNKGRFQTLLDKQAHLQGVNESLLHEN